MLRLSVKSSLSGYLKINLCKERLMKGTYFKIGRPVLSRFNNGFGSQLICFKVQPSGIAIY